VKGRGYGVILRYSLPLRTEEKSENFDEENRSPCLDFNPGPPEYEAWWHIQSAVTFGISVCTHEPAHYPPTTHTAFIASYIVMFSEYGIMDVKTTLWYYYRHYCGHH
jgi:Zn-dependent M28 family amino/carboxypeptidase